MGDCGGGHEDWEEEGTEHHDDDDDDADADADDDDDDDDSDDDDHDDDGDDDDSDHNHDHDDDDDDDDGRSCRWWCCNRCWGRVLLNGVAALAVALLRIARIATRFCLLCNSFM